MTERSKFQIPSKVFLLGEYAALCGSPSIIATVEPYFEFIPTERDCAAQFQPLSPAGRFLARNRLPIYYEFADPHFGKGGFGGSSAEFLAACYSQGMRNPAEIWDSFRDVTSGAKIQPSGADIVAQAVGGVVWWNPESRKTERLVCPEIWDRIMVFSATHQEGRKVSTHEHLDQFNSVGELCDTGLHKELGKILSSSEAAVQNSDVMSFAQNLNEFGRLLCEYGFEHSETGRERDVLMKVPGVIAAKGSGALQADSLVVMVESSSVKARVLSAAELLDLRLVSDGVGKTRGLLAESVL